MRILTSSRKSFTITIVLFLFFLFYCFSAHSSHLLYSTKDEDEDNDPRKFAIDSCYREDKHVYLSRGEVFSHFLSTSYPKKLRVLVWIANFRYKTPSGIAMYTFSVAQLFSLFPEAQVDLFVNVPPEEMYVTEIDPLLPKSSIHLVHWSLESYGLNWEKNPGFLEYTRKLDEVVNYDFILCRGRCSWFTEGKLEHLGKKTIFVQPDDMFPMRKEYARPEKVVTVGGLLAYMDPVSAERGALKFSENVEQIISIPPMLTFTPDKKARNGIRTHKEVRVCYLGLLHEDYLVKESIEGVELARKKLQNVKIKYLIYGLGKNDDYKIEENLVDLRDPISHIDALKVMISECDFGVRGYTEEYNFVSTKLIEMAAVGLPVLTNAQLVNQHLLGEDYPLFFSRNAQLAAQSFCDVLVSAITDEKKFTLASERVVACAQKFRLSSLFESLMPQVMKWRFEVK